MGKHPVTGGRMREPNEMDLFIHECFTTAFELPGPPTGA